MHDFHILTAIINPLRCFISGKKKINSFFRSHQIKESLCLRVVLWMIKICDFLSPFSIPNGWKVISNYFLWLFITTHPQSGPTWASVFSPQSCAKLPIYRWSSCLSVFKQGYTLGKISSLFKKDLEESQAAQAPAVRWSSCAITVMAEL